MINYKFRLITLPVYDKDGLETLERTIKDIRRVAEKTAHTFLFDDKNIEVEAIQAQEEILVTITSGKTILVQAKYTGDFYITFIGSSVRLSKDEQGF